MFRHLLLATDGSAHARRAAEVAVDLATTCDAKLTIVTVLPSSMSVDDIARAPQADRFSQEVQDDIQKMRETMESISMSDDVMYTSIPAPHSAVQALAEEILNDAEQQAEGRNVGSVERIIVIGDPASEILAQAEKSEADLIVLGTRGLSDIGAVFMGSVSHRVLHLSKCPCLMVK